MVRTQLKMMFERKGVLAIPPLPVSQAVGREQKTKQYPD